MKRFLAITLALLMTLSLFSGCGKKDDKDEASGSNINTPPATNAPSSGSNIPASRPPASGSNVTPVPPTPSVEYGEERELSNGENARSFETSFEQGPSFVIYVTDSYEASEGDEAIYVYSKNRPDEAYIEVKFIPGGESSKLAPSALDAYDDISNLVDNDTVDIGTIPYRFLEGQGKLANWKVYIVDGPAGAIQIVVRESEGEAETLDAMVRSFILK